YRMRVRMANPNHGRKPGELGTTAYGDKPELEATDDHWFTVGEYQVVKGEDGKPKMEDGKPKRVLVPQNVVVPPELYIYGVDQKRAEKDSYKFLYSETPRNPDRQAIVQIHKWVDETPVAGEAGSYTVADWVVGERVPVNKGEYVGREGKTDVPIWK